MRITTKDIFKKHRWFAWYPVILEKHITDNSYFSKEYVWLEWVIRERESNGYKNFWSYNK